MIENILAGLVHNLCHACPFTAKGLWLQCIDLSHILKAHGEVMTKAKGKRRHIISVDWAGLWREIKAFLYAIRWPSWILILTLASLFILRINLSHIRWNWQEILQYVAVLRWPVVTLVFLAIVRPFLPELVKRLRKAGWGDKYAEFEQGQEKQLSAEEERTLKIVAGDDVTTNDSATAQSAAAPPTGPELLSRDDVQLLFERIYREIYGSQLDALKSLRNFASGLNEKDLEEFFRQHQKAAPNPYPNVLSFMGYLVGINLVERDAATRVYRLTAGGSLFLDYLTNENILNNPKPF